MSTKSGSGSWGDSDRKINVYRQVERVVKYALDLLSDERGFWALAEAGRGAWERGFQKPLKNRRPSLGPFESLAKSFLDELTKSGEAFLQSFWTSNRPDYSGYLRGEWKWVGLDEKVEGSWKSTGGDVIHLNKHVRVRKRTPGYDSKSPVLQGCAN